METELFHMLFFQGIVRGKLDQLRRCFEVRVHSCRLFFCNSQVISVLFLHFVLLIQVQFAAGRDLRPEQLNNMIQTLANWYILLFRKYLLIMSHSVFSFIGYELFCVLLLIYLNYSLLVVCQYNLLILSKKIFLFSYDVLRPVSTEFLELCCRSVDASFVWMLSRFCSIIQFSMSGYFSISGCVVWYRLLCPAFVGREKIYVVVSHFGSMNFSFNRVGFNAILVF